MKGAGRGGFSIPGRQGELWQRKDRGPHPQYITHPQLGSPCPQERRRRGRWRRQRSRWRKQEGWRMWEDPCLHCQPNSWPRCLWRPGHLPQVRRSQSGGSSDLPWEGKAPQKEFLQAGKVKKTRKYWPGTVAL